MELKSINWERKEIETIPNKQGVYCLLNEDDKIIHVFKANDIRKDALKYFDTSELTVNKLCYKLFGKLAEAIEFQLYLEEQFIWKLDTFDRRIKDVGKIIDSGGLNHVALVLTITTLEIFLRDKFKEVWNFKWFEFEKKNRLEIRAKIIDVCKDMGKEDEFLKMVFIRDANSSDDFIQILYNLLFPLGNKSLIDFQRFSSKLSARWAYKNFLSIDLEKLLNDDDVHNWENLLSYVELRHKIIHGSVEPVDTAITEDDVIKVMQLVEIIKTKIDQLTVTGADEW